MTEYVPAETYWPEVAYLHDTLLDPVEPEALGNVFIREHKRTAEWETTDPLYDKAVLVHSRLRCMWSVVEPESTLILIKVGENGLLAKQLIFDSRQARLRTRSHLVGREPDEFHAWVRAIKEALGKPDPMEQPTEDDYTLLHGKLLEGYVQLS